jgi:hypothetical protein
MGDGYGGVRVDDNGRIKLKGALPDGSKFTQSTYVSSDGMWPLYVSLYRGDGTAIAWLEFKNQAQDDINGLMNWIKPAGIARTLYPNGLNLESKVAGSRYVRPASGGALNLQNGVVLFEGGDLASDFANPFTVDNRGRISDLSTNRLSLKFKTSDGTFAGRITDPTDGKTKHKFGGAVLQKVNAGYGFLSGTEKSSRVTISP